MRIKHKDNVYNIGNTNFIVDSIGSEIRLSGTGDTSLIFSLAEWRDLVRIANISIYFIVDIKNYTKGKYKPELFEDPIFENIAHRYAILREENNGGNTGEILNWVECCDKAFLEYADQVHKYKLS